MSSWIVAPDVRSDYYTGPSEIVWFISVSLFNADNFIHSIHSGCEPTRLAVRFSELTITSARLLDVITLSTLNLSMWVLP